MVAKSAMKISHTDIRQRCINIDWLECYCEEPESHQCDAEWYRSRGWEVQPRDFGTPQYREMFTLKKDGEPLLEVRRSPYSVKSNGGVFLPRACHLRLTNSACYSKDPVGLMREFITSNEIIYHNITRVDICLDLKQFDDGKLPQDFVAEYMEGRFFKVHLTNLSGYGEERTGGSYQVFGKDSQYQRIYSSIKWGSASSKITVKLYDKTKEMGEQRDKPYIRNYWYAAGLLSSEDNVRMAKIRDNRYNIAQIDKKLRKGTNEKLKAIRNNLALETLKLKEEVPKIWRVEISLKSEVKGIVAAEELDLTPQGKRRIYELSLNAIDSKDKQLFLFHVFANRYFCFKVPGLTRQGRPQRKDRCKDYFPVESSTMELAFEPVVIKKTVARSRTLKMFINNLRELVADEKLANAIGWKQKAGIIETLHYIGKVAEMQELQDVIDTVSLKQENEATWQIEVADRLVRMRKYLEELVEKVI